MKESSDVGSAVVTRLVSALLDPVLRGGPFLRGDAPDGYDLVAEWPSPWPEPEHSVRLVWRAAGPEVADLLPRLWQQVRHPVPPGGGGVGLSIDLTVDLDVLGRLVAADIEAVPLAELLAGVGEPEAAAAAAELPGLSGEVAVPALADLLERLLSAST